MTVKNKWFPFGYHPQAKKAKTVFCFHCAGGNSSIYKDWALAVSSVQFVPVELPGRGIRISEPCLENFNQLINEITAVLSNVIDSKTPLCFYGHSMGAAVAFETVYQLNTQYKIPVEKLIIAGRHAPHHPDPSAFKSYMGEAALIHELKKLGGTPAVVLENKELLQFLLPIIKSDYKLHESYSYRGYQLNIPVIAHAGKEDDEATGQVMKHWAEITNKKFEMQEFTGKHFFIQALGEKYFSALLKTVLAA